MPKNTSANTIPYNKKRDLAKIRNKKAILNTDAGCKIDLH